jgi:hypothetical protein
METFVNMSVAVIEGSGLQQQRDSVDDLHTKNPYY